MAGALERQGAPRVDLGLDRLHPIRDPSTGEDPVEAADARDQELEVVDPVTDRVGQLGQDASGRSEEHTSELQSRQYLVCRLLLEKKKKQTCCHSKTKNDEH